MLKKAMTESAEETIEREHRTGANKMRVTETMLRKMDTRSGGRT